MEFLKPIESVDADSRNPLITTWISDQVIRPCIMACRGSAVTSQDGENVVAIAQKFCDVEYFNAK